MCTFVVSSYNQSIVANESEVDKLVVCHMRICHAMNVEKIIPESEIILLQNIFEHRCNGAYL